MTPGLRVFLAYDAMPAFTALQGSTVARDARGRPRADPLP